MGKSSEVEERVFEWLISPVSDALARKSFDLQKKGGLESEQHYINRVKGSLTEELMVKSLREEIAKGFDKLEHELPKKLSSSEWKIFQKQLRSGTLFHASGSSILVDLKKNEDPNFQKILGISDQMMVHFYEIASECYQQKDYDSASAIFRILTFLSPMRYQIWLSLGIANQYRKHFDEALHAFAFSTLLNGKDPSCRFYAAKCYVQQNQYKDAKEELEAGLEIAEAIGKADQWKKFAEDIRYAIQGKK